jgi:ribosomal protein L11 methyltransferase
LERVEVDITLNPRVPFTDVFMYLLSCHGFDSFEETEQGFRAYINRDVFNEELFKGLATMEGCEINYTVIAHKTQNWNEIWESSFKPISVEDKVYVRAPFHASPGNKIPYEIVIEPKMSFGTGHHDTTWLMMHEMLKLDLRGKTVLDMGCGTGILSILASKLGAESVLAVDIEDWSIVNARENISVNNAGSVFVEKGDADLLEGRSFHAILANINRNVLLAHLKHYSKVLVNNGDLLLSGFFTTDAKLLEDEAAALGLKKNSLVSRNEWCVLHFKK